MFTEQNTDRRKWSSSGMRSVKVTESGGLPSLLHKRPQLELFPGEQADMLEQTNRQHNKEFHITPRNLKILKVFQLKTKRNNSERSRNTNKNFVISKPTLRKTSRSMTPRRRASPR